jgi:hypothetical protein
MYGDGHAAVFGFRRNYGPDQQTIKPIGPTSAWW